MKLRRKPKQEGTQSEYIGWHELHGELKKSRFLKFSVRFFIAVVGLITLLASLSYCQSGSEPTGEQPPQQQEQQ